MSKVTQQVFRRIAIHNKLLPEDELDALLSDFSDPLEALKQLVERQVMSQNTASQFEAVFKKQVNKLFAEQIGQMEETLETKPPCDAEQAKPSHAASAPASPIADLPAVSDSGTEEQVNVTRHDRARSLALGGVERIHSLMQQARQLGASDLHVISGIVPVVRVNGLLRELPCERLSADVAKQSLLSVLTEEQKTTFYDKLELDFSYDGGEELGRYRANLLFQHRGVDGVFRLIPETIPSFQDLNLPDAVKRFTEHRVGVVLVTGPKGSGKTTTLAAMVDRINRQRAEHIITLEDPIEFVHPCKRGHVNQRQVGTHTHSFSNALRSALREAPDVIMVGEMRDLETTSLAITAAETGHLVLATLHTPDAVRTIGRILDEFPPKEQPQIRAMLSESLCGICSQLLLPGADGESMALAVEVLVNTQAIGHLIREEKVHQIHGVMETGKQHGMILMDDSLIRLAKAGRITAEVAGEYAHNAKYVKAELASEGV
ncbi:type IV pilus twitching motility protein PilT [Novipirellula artificiosorum]|uniref:Twitching mobility protein n=1 Tax=Novipirellula artificiosorum TaxID=2528016 RepID=A0A5C6DCC0_9BACT|nr:type IV pilus twitching motility protein PilT [Novipirellula artificiosorum]TWU33361.1 Twitching mobility protein [Novipirellula artificiosorum]